MPKGRPVLPENIVARLPELRQMVRERKAIAHQSREEAKQANYEARIQLEAAGITIDTDTSELTRPPNPRDKTFVVKFGPKVLSYMKSAKTLEGDRDLKEPHLLDLIDRFLRCPINHNLAFGHYNGEYYRLDGKHTQALVEHFPDLFDGTLFVIAIYECDNEWELTMLYQQFNGFKRGPGDIIRPTIVTKGVNMKESVTTAVITGIENAIHNTRNKLTSNEQAELLNRHLSFFDWLVKNKFLLRAASKCNLTRIPNYTALFMVWLSDPEGAEKFWREAESGGGGKGDPARELVDWCFTTDGPRSHGDPYEQHINVFLYCWNAWCEKKKIKRFYKGDMTNILPVNRMDDSIRSSLKIFTTTFEPQDMNKLKKTRAKGRK